MAPAIFTTALIALPIILSTYLAYAGYTTYKRHKRHRHRHAPHDIERAQNMERTRQNDEGGTQLHSVSQRDGVV